MFGCDLLLCAQLFVQAPAHSTFTGNTKSLVQRVKLIWHITHKGKINQNIDLVLTKIGPPPKVYAPSPPFSKSTTARTTPKKAYCTSVQYFLAKIEAYRTVPGTVPYCHP